MAYTVSWLVEGRILYAALYGDLPIEDIRTGSREALKLIETGTPPVHGIVDMTTAGAIPLPLVEAVRVNESLRHPNIGWAVLVGTHNRLLEVLLPVAAVVFPFRYQLTRTLPEARAFLAEKDSTLPPV